MMSQYYLGRFSLAVPKGMLLDAHTPTIRGIKVHEFEWRQSEEQQRRREQEWKKHLSEIAALQKPKGVTSIIIEDLDFPSFGRWARGVYYFGNDAQSDEGYWDLLVDAGDVGVWFKYDGRLDAKNIMLDLLLQAAKHYQSFQQDRVAKSSLSSSFCTRYGRVDLPYRDEETTYARFKDNNLQLQLEVEMNDTHVDEPQEEGLLARTVAAIATGYALGVDIKKIRGRNREVAGLKGEEQVVEMKDKRGTSLDFTWRYAGKRNSGEFPEIIISMESPDGDLKQKLELWDAILDSMKPLYRPAPR